MASIFSQPAQFDIGYEQPVVDKSSSVFSSIGTSLMKGLDTGIRASIASDKENKVSYSEQKDLMEQKSLASYTQGVKDIWGRVQSGELNNQAGVLQLRSLRTSYASRGVDVTSEPYDLVTSDITGLSEERVQFTDNQILINDMMETPEGQAKITSAMLTLKGRKIDPNEANIAAQLRETELKAVRFNEINVATDLDFVTNEAVFKETITEFRNKTKDMVTYLEEEGVTITDEMFQNQYSEFLDLKSLINSKIPGTVEAGLRSGLDKQFEQMDNFFKGMGLEEKNGAIVFREDQTVYDLDIKVKTILNAFEKSESEVDKMLAMQIVSAGYQIKPDVYPVLEARLAELGNALPSLQPEKLVNADTIVADSLVETYNRTQAYLNSDANINLGKIEDNRKYVLSKIPKEQADQWAAMTNEQGFKSFSTFSQVLEGFNERNIKDMKLKDGLFTNFTGLSLSLESINFDEDVISAKGLTTLLGGNVPRLLNLLERTDSVQGAAARDMLFNSVASAKVQYEQRLKAEIQDQAIMFNSETKRFELDVTKLRGNPEQNTLITELVRDYYKGDVMAALRDQFEEGYNDKIKITSSTNLTDRISDRLLLQTYMNTSESQINQVSNIMAASTYLSKFADLISPQTYKDFVKEQEQRLGFIPVGDTSQPVVNNSVSSIGTSSVNTSNNLMTGNVDESIVPVTSEAGTISSDNQGAGVAPNAVSSPTEPAPKDNPISVARWFINSAVTKDGTKILDIMKEEQKNLATADEIRELILEEISNNKDFYKKSIQEYLKSEDVPVGSWYKNLDGTVFQLK